MSLPDQIDSEERLETWLSEPTPGVTEVLQRHPGDILLLGAAGKMGPSLARLIRRSDEVSGIKRRVWAVSRFSQPAQETALQAAGAETIRGDLLDPSLAARLPEAPMVVFMTGMKFGATGQESRLWAMNTLVPARLADRFRSSRWLAFSTGNVYPLRRPEDGGCTEEDAPDPVGEYGMSALGRERVLDFMSREHGIPMSVVRLNYACDLRYGVLVDVARRIARHEPVPLGMAWFNTIWQGDANAMALQALDRAASPPFVINVTGPETLRVREVAGRLGRILGKSVSFEGEEGTTALLNDASRAIALWGPPRVPADRMVSWVGHWMAGGGRTLDKPTRFEVRSGRF